MITVETEPKKFVCVVKHDDNKIENFNCPNCLERDFVYGDYNESFSTTDIIIRIRCKCGAETIFIGKTSLIDQEKTFI